MGRPVGLVEPKTVLERIEMQEEGERKDDVEFRRNREYYYSCYTVIKVVERGLHMFCKVL